MSEIRPDGAHTTLSFDDDGEVLIGIAFVRGDERRDYVLTENEADYLVRLLSETLVRAAVVREMTTMFPEMRDSIVDTLTFRWTEEV